MQKKKQKTVKKRADISTNNDSIVKIVNVTHENHNNDNNNNNNNNNNNKMLPFIVSNNNNGNAPIIENKVTNNENNDIPTKTYDLQNIITPETISRNDQKALVKQGMVELQYTQQSIITPKKGTNRGDFVDIKSSAINQKFAKMLKLKIYL